MTWNPYAPKSLRREWQMAGTGAPIRDALKASVRNARTGTHDYGTENAIGRNGEINAGSKRELMSQISNLIDHAGSGRIHNASVTEHTASATERLAMLREAMADKSGQSFQVLGEVRFA